MLAGLDEGELPLPITGTLVRLCGESGPMEFRGRGYEQIQGLAMNLPFSAVLAQLFMETLEADHYQNRGKLSSLASLSERHPRCSADGDEPARSPP